MTAANSATPTADREIVITRELDAPRELVFEAFTDPKHIAQWWGPTGFTNTIRSMDVRPGGVLRFVMHGPDGVDYVNEIRYIEITTPPRLVHRHGPGAGHEKKGDHAEGEGDEIAPPARRFGSSRLRDRGVLSSAFLK